MSYSSSSKFQPSNELNVCTLLPEHLFMPNPSEMSGAAIFGEQQHLCYALRIAILQSQPKSGYTIGFGCTAYIDHIEVLTLGPNVLEILQSQLNALANDYPLCLKFLITKFHTQNGDTRVDVEIYP